MMLPEKECPPGANRGASRTTGQVIATAVDSSLYHRQDGYVAPPAEDRADDAFMAEMLARGYRPSVDCLICGHPLTNNRSVARHVGPKCRAKLAAAEAVTE